MTTDLDLGRRCADARATSGLSREKFAQRVGLTPGAIWRIEVKGNFKEHELSKIAVEFPDVLDGGVIAVSTEQVKVVPVPVTGVGAMVDLGFTSDDAQDVWDDSVQWVDVSANPTWVTPIEQVVDVPWQSIAWATRDSVISPTMMSTLDGFTRFANSELYTSKDCARRWWLTYYRGLRPIIESPTGARATGDRVHRALERWYVPDATQRTDPRDALERLIVGDWTALVRATAAEGEGVSLAQETAFKKDADLQRAMIEGYVKWLEDTGADSDYVVVEPEAYLEADLPELGDVKIIAKIDVRVRRTPDGARLWLEHKTVGSFQQKLATIALDEQVLHQTLVERLQPDDQPRVIGVLYNMLRRVKRGATAKPPFYQRVEVHHNEHELDSYRRRVAVEVENITRMRARLDAGADHRDVVAPRPSGDCAWKCPFVQICPMLDDGSRVESAISQYFATGDPYEYYLPKAKE